MQSDSNWPVEQAIAFLENEQYSFNEKALQVFRFQYTHNPLYKKFCNLLNREPGDVQSIREIPFLPISFFKSHEILSVIRTPVLQFESSGTTGLQTSRHFVYNAEVYLAAMRNGFKKFYGDFDEWCILALLPNYLERQNSSLIYMVDDFIKLSNHPDSGFYLHDLDKLANTLRENERKGTKTLLMGVTFALLDLSEQFATPLQHTIIMETGGMKGRRKELTRQEVHDKLKAAFDMENIHSEYGMTELLSQAYSDGKGIFQPADSMQVVLRAIDDPLEIWTKDDVAGSSAAGVINVIDLANVYSCSFIATDDVGTLYANGSFEVAGRLDNSDMRGCSFLLL